MSFPISNNFSTPVELIVDRDIFPSSLISDNGRDRAVYRQDILMEKYFYIAGTLALTLYGQLIMKARALVHAPDAARLSKFSYLWAMYTDIGVLSGLMAGVLASVCWALAVEKASLSVAYPFMALSFVVVPLSASVLFFETISPRQFIGLCVIVVGVALSTTGR